MIIWSISLIKDLLRAWKVLGCHYLKSGNSLDETHREEIGQPAVKRKLGESYPCKIVPATRRTRNSGLPSRTRDRSYPETRTLFKYYQYFNFFQF